MAGSIQQSCCLAANRPCPKQEMMFKSLALLLGLGFCFQADEGHRAPLSRAPVLCPASPWQLQHSTGEERGCGKCPLQERGDILVRKGHKGVKPFKHSPLLSASVSRVRQSLRESLQKANEIYLQHREMRINTGGRQVSCSPSSMSQQGLSQPCRTCCRSPTQKEIPMFNSSDFYYP